MLPGLEAIIQGTVETLRAEGSLGTVDSREHGKSTWAETPRPGQTYVIVDHLATQSESVGVGGSGTGHGTARRTRQITVDVWSPWAYSLGSADRFRDVIENVLWCLVSRPELGVCARMVAPPEEEYVKIEPYTSLNQGDTAVFCHHARIVFETAHYQRVQGEG